MVGNHSELQKYLPAGCCTELSTLGIILLDFFFSYLDQI